MNHRRARLSGLGCLGGIALFVGGVTVGYLGSDGWAVAFVVPGVVMAAAGCAAGQWIICPNCRLKSWSIGPVLGRCPRCRTSWADDPPDDQDSGW